MDKKWWWIVVVVVAVIILIIFFRNQIQLSPGKGYGIDVERDDPRILVPDDGGGIEVGSADFNSDGDVNMADFEIFVDILADNGLGPCTGLQGSNTGRKSSSCAGDLNGDNVRNINDIGEFAEQWDESGVDCSEGPGLVPDDMGGFNPWFNSPCELGATGECFVVGDVNDDHTVDVDDLTELLDCFGQPASAGCGAEDVNGDGVVNVLDLIDLLLNFSPDTIQVPDQAGLDNVRNDLDAYYKQICDIDLVGEFQPIGTPGEAFTGTYNGDGHIISNFNYNDPSDNAVGLFRVLNGATVTDLGLENVNVVGNNQVGALASTIFENSNIMNSYVKGGSVTGSNTVGGLSGFLFNSNTIEDSYSGVIVNGNSQVGGFIGVMLPGNTISNSYWDTESSGQSGSAGGEGRTTVEMTSVPRPPNTYINWNFVNIWDQVNGEYPLLRAFGA